MTSRVSCWNVGRIRARLSFIASPRKRLPGVAFRRRRSAASGKRRRQLQPRRSLWRHLQPKGSPLTPRPSLAALGAATKRKSNPCAGDEQTPKKARRAQSKPKAKVARRARSNLGGEPKAKVARRARSARLPAADALNIFGHVQEPDAVHLARHRDTPAQNTCARCHYLNGKASIQRMCSYKSGSQTLVWCEPRPQFMGGAWALGCSACAWAHAQCPDKLKGNRSAFAGDGRKGGARKSTFAKYEFRTSTKNRSSFTA